MSPDIVTASFTRRAWWWRATRALVRLGDLQDGALPCRGSFQFSLSHAIGANPDPHEKCTAFRAARMLQGANIPQRNCCPRSPLGIDRQQREISQSLKRSKTRPSILVCLRSEAAKDQSPYVPPRAQGGSRAAFHLFSSEIAGLRSIDRSHCLPAGQDWPLD